MKFEKGKAKTGGRRKGTLNKMTFSIRQKLLGAIDNNLDSIQNDLNNLTPQERLNIFLKLLEYAIPKPQQLKIYLSALSNEEVEQLIETIIEKNHE